MSRKDFVRADKIQKRGEWDKNLPYFFTPCHHTQKWYNQFMILHIDMDAFFASVEQAVNPRLRGKPLIVGSRANKYYTVVAAASYEAKRLGIDSGMATKDAFLICPNAEFVAADSAKYIYTSEKIFELLHNFNPNPLYASVDEFQLDCPELSSGQVGQEIKAQIKARFNITCSIGVAKNYLLSKLASKIDKPDGLVILTGENLRPILASLPIEKLCGVGSSTQIKLNRLGIFSCLDLYDCPQDLLTFNLGQVGYNLFWGLKREEKISAFAEPEPPKSIGHSYTLPRTSKDPKIILGWLRLLAEMVASRLRAKDWCAKTIHLFLGGQNSRIFGGQKAFQEPTNDGFEILSRSLKIAPKLAQIKAPIRLLGITTSSFSRPQNWLLEEPKKRERLLKSVDKINQKFGDWSVFPAQILQAKSKQQQ